MRLLLIGAGGHARSVAAAATSAGHEIAAYDDPKTSDWCRALRLEVNVTLPPDIVGGVMGVGGTVPADLASRMELLDRFYRRGLVFPMIVHPSAILADDVEIAEAAVILAGAIVQPGARIGRGVIINTGAIIEHDAVIEDGVHIAPSAIVLGGSSVGVASMIGAGAVVLPGSAVPGATLVKSLERFNGKNSR